jgi:hypothetical protein
MNLLAKNKWDSTSVEAEFHKRLGFLSKKHQGLVMHHFREVLRNQLRDPSLKEIVADLSERAGIPLADHALSVLDQPIEGYEKPHSDKSSY